MQSLFRRAPARLLAPSRVSAASRRQPFSSSSSSHSTGGAGGSEFNNLAKDLPIPSARQAAAVVAGCFGFYIAKNSILQTNAGITYVLQNSLTGELKVFDTPGIHFRVPFFSNVTPYKQVMTASFGAGQGAGPSSFGFNETEPVRVRFADTYMGTVPCTFRFRLSTDMDQVRQMHKDFRSEDKLANTLLARNCRNVVNITATQYTGEEFFQGGLNEFKQKLEDQLKDGIYKTERKQVTVNTMDLAPIARAPAQRHGTDEDNGRSEIRRQRQMVWKTVNVLDDNNLPIRSETPLKQYGITVTQVTVGNPTPEKLLQTLLVDKKQLVGARIKAVQEQETAKEQSKTAQVCSLLLSLLSLLPLFVVAVVTIVCHFGKHICPPFPGEYSSDDISPLSLLNNDNNISDEKGH